MGFKISSWFELGERRLPILLSTTNSSGSSASISSIRFLCEGWRKKWYFEKTASEESDKPWGFVMPQNWTIEFLSGDPKLWLAFNNLPKTTENNHCARKKAQLFFYWLIHEQPSIGKDSTVCTPSEFVSKFDCLQLLSGTNTMVTPALSIICKFFD